MRITIKTRIDIMDKHETLAAWLTYKSSWICSLNDCTDEKHNCESYAYIDKDMRLLDVCASDFFQGSDVPYAAIPLPWLGSQAELEEEVKSQCKEFFDE